MKKSSLFEEISKLNLCRNNKKVQVLESGAGFYIGTLDEDGCPYCRISTTYYETSEQAQSALNSREFIERECAENIFCNGTIGMCFVSYMPKVEKER
jgi:hypothetical protein